MSPTMPDHSNFVALLLQEVPELQPVYDAHVDDFDELLEHVFMGDVTRFCEDLCKRDSDSECFIRLLKFLNQAYLSDDEKVRELVSVSFLENLSWEDRCYRDIKAHLSDELTAELSLYEANR